MGQDLDPPLPQTPPHSPSLSNRASGVGGGLRQAEFGALSVGGELSPETGDPPERAQPSLGLDAYKRRLVLFSGCLLLLKHTYSRTLPGQLHPHSGTKPDRVESEGLSWAKPTGRQ